MAEWVGSRAAAERLGISLRTLYRLIDEGQLTGYQIGRNIRLRHDDLEAFLEGVRINPGELRHLYHVESYGAGSHEVIE
ncbi:MAG: helix-turn-helix domain-containing protein [Ferrimicrobium sp.]